MCVWLWLWLWIVLNWCVIVLIMLVMLFRIWVFSFVLWGDFFGSRKMFRVFGGMRESKGLFEGSRVHWCVLWCMTVFLSLPLVIIVGWQLFVCLVLYVETYCFSEHTRLFCWSNWNIVPWLARVKIRCLGDCLPVMFWFFFFFFINGEKGLLF